MQLPLHCCCFLALLTFATHFTSAFQSGNSGLPRWPRMFAMAPTTTDDIAATVQRLTHEAISNPRDNHDALRELKDLCSRRIPYDFSKVANNGNIASVPSLLPTNVTAAMVELVESLESQKIGLSTNPDSVDGLPSLHLNLISGGQDMVSEEYLDEHTDVHDEEYLLASTIRKLLDLIQTPYLEDTLLPRARQITGLDSLTIQDVFLRRYPASTRRTLSAHYDVTSRVTAVVALDDVAAHGADGLYTGSSNHAALRRFFPLPAGSAVVHTWDVLHGVDVAAEDADRTSLIIWFGVEDQGDESKMDPIARELPVAPWLTGSARLVNDDVAQFVLASAISSIDFDETQEDQTNQNIHMLANELYLKSASRGNVFALTRMGSLCEELTEEVVKYLQGDDHVGEERVKSIGEFARRAHISCQNLSKEKKDYLSLLPDFPDDSPHALLFMLSCLSKQFWLEGALRGNPMAQHALADELMMEATSGEFVDYEKIDMVATLFELAAQQGHAPSNNSLARMNAYLESMSRE